jgi:hypothetical protein
MKRFSFFWVFAIILSSQAFAQAPMAGEKPVDPKAQAAVQKMMTGPSVFIENAGQWPDADIHFALDGRGMNVGLTDKCPRFQLFKRGKPADDAAKSVTQPPTTSSMHPFSLMFDGATTVSPVGRGRSERTFNYLQGDVANHRNGVGSFETVWYEGLYPGVALELSGQKTGLKYNFHVAPRRRFVRVRFLTCDFWLG